MWDALLISENTNTFFPLCVDLKCSNMLKNNDNTSRKRDENCKGTIKKRELSCYTTVCLGTKNNCKIKLIIFARLRQLINIVSEHRSFNLVRF